MNSVALKREHGVVGLPKYRPAVSIILSFDQRINLKRKLDYKLKIAVEKAERELMANYPANLVVPVLKRLRHLTGLKYDAERKGIAIFVSTAVEKVFYLDINVEDKIIIDESFEIRDLAHSQNLSIRYLVLILHDASFKIYLCRSSVFTLVKTETTERASDAEVPVNNRKQASDQFLYRADKEVSILLKAYSLPVFVMGPEKPLQQFKHLSKCGQSIVQYIYGSYLNKKSVYIYKVLKPRLACRENE